MDAKEKSQIYQYDENTLAAKYAKCSYFHESRLLVDAFNLKKIVRSIQALSSEPIERVLDVGCGDGFMTRMLVHDDVVKHAAGIDISKDMIELAKRFVESHEQENFQYCAVSEDFESAAGLIGRYPLVMSTFMLCHSSSVNKLEQILSRIHRLCNRFFFGLLPNPRFNVKTSHTLEKYRINYNCPLTPVDEDSYHVTFDVGTDNEFTLTAFWYTTVTYESLFHKVGFKTFEWVPIEVDSSASEERKSYLADVCQTYIGFIATV